MSSRGAGYTFLIASIEIDDDMQIQIAVSSHTQSQSLEVLNSSLLTVSLTWGQVSVVLVITRN